MGQRDARVSIRTGPRLCQPARESDRNVVAATARCCTAGHPADRPADHSSPGPGNANHCLINIHAAPVLRSRGVARTEPPHWLSSPATTPTGRPATLPLEALSRASHMEAPYKDATRRRPNRGGDRRASAALTRNACRLGLQASATGLTPPERDLLRLVTGRPTPWTSSR